MSFIFGGGQQEKQRRQTPQMVKLPQVGAGLAMGLALGLGLG